MKQTSWALVWILAIGGALAAEEPAGHADHKDQTSEPAARTAKTATEKGIFPKSIPIPGTTVSIGFGGYAKVDFIQDFDGIGNADQFQTRHVSSSP